MRIVFTLPMRNSHLSKKQRLGYGFNISFALQIPFGSAAPHEYDLVLGNYSVHTSPDALRNAEAHISAIRTRLVQEGRL
jgi:hypothetical protein